MTISYNSFPSLPSTPRLVPVQQPPNPQVQRFNIPTGVHRDNLLHNEFGISPTIAQESIHGYAAACPLLNINSFRQPVPRYPIPASLPVSMSPRISLQSAPEALFTGTGYDGKGLQSHIPGDAQQASGYFSHPFGPTTGPSFVGTCSPVIPSPRIPYNPSTLAKAQPQSEYDVPSLTGSTAVSAHFLVETFRVPYSTILGQGFDSPAGPRVENQWAQEEWNPSRTDIENDADGPLGESPTPGQTGWVNCSHRFSLIGRLINVDFNEAGGVPSCVRTVHSLEFFTVSNFFISFSFFVSCHRQWFTSILALWGGLCCMVSAWCYLG